MVNYEIDPAALADLVPAGTELDSWNGRTLVSLVGFRFLRTKVLGIPIPFHRDFEELNLRFYVRREGPEGWRRGVVFVQEIVPRRAIAWVARTVYNENYVAMQMRHSIDELDAGGRSAEYGWLQGERWSRLRVETTDPPDFPSADSEETFITEHYWGYARQRDGGTLEYRVEHPQWRVSRATRAEFDGDAAALYGPRFEKGLAATPASAFLADGSPIVVRRGTPIS